ncbi:MAG: PKD domain-containing protein [Nanoarchaeota archaeon]
MKKYSKILGCLILLMIALNLSVICAESEKIQINLKYQNDKYYDNNSDGVEGDKSVIDFTVEDTEFNWDLNKNKLCTRWEILSVDTNKMTTVCYGNNVCCNFIGLTATKNKWNDIFYLNYGQYDASVNNKVSARVLYVDYSVSSENPYSEIYYSNYDYLYAVFLDEDYFNGKQPSSKEFSVIEKLERLKKNNKLSKISLTDLKGGSAVSDFHNQNLRLDMYHGGDIVSIENFKSNNIQFEELDKITISKEDENLRNHIENLGSIVRKSIEVSGIEKVILEEGYQGRVEFNITGIIYNQVLHCSDSFECVKLPECDFGAQGCYHKNGDKLEVYVSHFSSIIVALNMSELNLTINSPVSPLKCGENVYLNFSTDIPVYANISFKNQRYAALPESKTFSVLLNGSFSNGVIENGAHIVTISLNDNNSNILTYNYSFSVNDDAAPKINLTYNSIPVNNSVVTNSSNITNLKLRPNEYAFISYKLNNGQYSTEAYFGKEKSITLELKTGANILLINATDMQGNNQLYSYSFSFSYSATCLDGIKNGGETGIDCGGQCGNCVGFSISLDKSNYELGEDIAATIISRANSIVNMTVKTGGSVVSRKSITGYSSDYPIYVTTILDNINSPSTYTLNATSYYKGNSESKIVSFIVYPPTSTLSVQISANKTTINEGETVKFVPIVSGHTGSLTYQWDISNDKSIDSYSSELVKTYATNGTYKVNLTVTDSAQKASDIETIIVKKRFNVTIIVNNVSKQNVGNADVEFDTVIKNTTSEGKTSFLVYYGTYKLKVKHDGYNTYINDSVRVFADTTLYVNLSIDTNDKKGPVVTLLNPPDQQRIEGTSVEILYRVEDQSNVDCALNINEHSSWWIEKESQSNVLKGSENKFSITSLQNGSYEYRIKCTDEHGNSEISSTRTFIVYLFGKTLNKDNTEIDPLISKIDQIYQEFQKKGKTEKEVMDILGIFVKLDKSKVKLTRYKRDLNNLIWRKLNDTEYEKEENAIYAEIANIRDAIPTDLKVLDSKEFVVYPKAEEIRNLTLAYLNKKNKKYTKREINNVVEQNSKLQSLLTVTTKAFVVELEYLSNDKERYTLVEKAFSLDLDSNGYIMIEYIPKEIAESVNDIEFMFEYSVIEEDPIIELSLEEAESIAYYVQDEIELEKIQTTVSVIMDPGQKPELSPITGFAVIDNLKSKFVTTSDRRIVIEVFVIIILVLLYLGYTLKGTNIKYHILDRASLKNVDSIKNNIENAKKELNDGKYDRAKSLYLDSQSSYSKLPKEMRKEVYQSVVALSYKLDVFHIKSLIDKAISKLENNKRTEAVEIYHKVNEIYKKIVPEYKSEVIKKCGELREKLSK